VERHLREALKRDRARIQVGRMSGFGLIEMTRQRLHSSFLESSYKPCPHCGGQGVVRTVASSAMRALRLLEEVALKNMRTSLILTVPSTVAEYLSNYKRVHLLELEKNYQVGIQVMADDSLLKTDDLKLERIRDDGQKISVSQETTPLPHGPKVDLSLLGDEIVIGDDVKGRHGHRRNKDWHQAKSDNKAKEKSQNTGKEVTADTKEENFKVVEQQSLVENEQMAEGKDQKNTHHKRHKRPHPAQENQPEPPTPEKPKEVKKGWWNRLVN